jgi:hypothetical protein
MTIFGKCVFCILYEKFILVKIYNDGVSLRVGLFAAIFSD